MPLILSGLFRSPFSGLGLSSFHLSRLRFLGITSSSSPLSTIFPISISLLASQSSPAALTSKPPKASAGSIGNKREGKQAKDIRDKERRKWTWERQDVTSSENALLP